jgi:arylsulfatase A-like enzyme
LAHDYFPDHLWNNQTRIDLPNTFQNQTQYAGDLIQRQALDFMAQNKNKPFFLYLSYTLPHAALQLPNGDANLEYYKKQFNEQPIALKPWDGKGYQPHAYTKAAYAAMVQKMDDYVGQVMQQLVTLGLDKNTLVIFTSDNGPHREGGNNPDFFNSNGGLRGIKRDLYEGGMREPMIARWPATIKAGQVSTQTGAFWDFLPTFAQLTNQATPLGIDGLSILPTLTAKGKQEQHEYYYWEFHENGGRQAVRMGDWKGVRYNALANPNGPIELYNLSTDLAEKNNLSSTRPDLVARMQEIMKTAHVENKDFPFYKTK